MDAVFSQKKKINGCCQCQLLLPGRVSSVACTGRQVRDYSVLYLFTGRLHVLNCVHGNSREKKKERESLLYSNTPNNSSGGKLGSCVWLTHGVPYVVSCPSSVTAAWNGPTPVASLLFTSMEMEPVIVGTLSRVMTQFTRAQLPLLWVFFLFNNLNSYKNLQITVTAVVHYSNRLPLRQ